jgi:phosphatidate cytidylyltransferase
MLRQRRKIDVDNYSQTEELSEDSDCLSSPQPPSGRVKLATVDEQQQSFEQRTKFRTRTVWTVGLISSFFAIIAAGHFYCSVLVILLVGAIFYEITKLKRNHEKEHRLPFFFGLRWYFFMVTLFYFLKVFLPVQLNRLALQHPPIGFVLKYHQLISYALILIGLVVFVLSLRRFTLRYQFQQLSWAIVTLLICVIQASAHIANIYSGLVWFLLPTLLVIVNDIFAYLFGIMIGKTPLIKLSPKKTLEGFIGGSIATIIFAVILCEYMERYSFFMCPNNDITPIPYQAIECPEFKPRYGYIGPSELKIHGLILASFASLVAPFGGFFASGFKRAFKIKDFSQVFESHGGFTDRFDCQIVMGMFTYIYVNTFVSSSVGHGSTPTLTIESVASFIQTLNHVEKVKLLSLIGQ